MKPVPRLSIVIPCVQDARQFEGTLASVLQNRPADCEVLVVQPRAYDDPYELGREVRFVEASADATTVDLINTGVAQATGAVVHVLSCDVEVMDGWTDPIWAHFADQTVGTVSPLVVTPDGQSVASRGVHYGVGGRRIVQVKSFSRRQRAGGVAPRVAGPTLAAGFYRRQVLLDAAGFCREVGEELADADLAVFLRARGWQTVHEADSLIRLSGEPSRRGPSFQHGRQAERLFWRNASANSRVVAYVAHTCVVLAEVLGNLLRPTLALHLLGRACAMLESSSYRQRRDQLSAARERVCEAEADTVPFTRRSHEPEASGHIRPRSAA